MDKMLISPDSDVVVSNDGATIMEQMEVSHFSRIQILFKPVKQLLWEILNTR